MVEAALADIHLDALANFVALAIGNHVSDEGGAAMPLRNTVRCELFECSLIWGEGECRHTGVTSDRNYLPARSLYEEISLFAPC